jgi:metallo-beta-lactamase class B
MSLPPLAKPPHGRRAAALVLACAVAGAFAPTSAQLDTEQERAWNEPVEPFRIVGNVYYVGAAEVASYLIATAAGHFVLDSGFRDTVPQVLANIERLGFAPGDVKWLLSSHVHYDHVGGMAELEARTGAAVALSAGDAEQASRGGLGDFAFGDQFGYAPFTADRLVADREGITLAGTTVTAHLTPGHTRGCTTWTVRVEERGEPLDVLFLCSVTAPGYRLVGNEAYPGIVEDYRATFRRLESVPVDVFLANHGSFFDLHRKRAALCANPARNPFIDPAGYRAHLAARRAELERRVVEQGGR